MGGLRGADSMRTPDYIAFGVLFVLMLWPRQPIFKDDALSWSQRHDTDSILRVGLNYQFH
jgi:hypothetical protein